MKLGSGKRGVMDTEGARAGVGSSFRPRTDQPLREPGLFCVEIEGKKESWAGRDAEELVPRMRSSAGGGESAGSPEQLGLSPWRGPLSDPRLHPFPLNRVQGLNSGQAPPLLTLRKTKGKAVSLWSLRPTRRSLLLCSFWGFLCLARVSRRGWGLEVGLVRQTALSRRAR